MTVRCYSGRTTQPDLTPPHSSPRIATSPAPTTPVQSTKKVEALATTVPPKSVLTGTSDDEVDTSKFNSLIE